MQIQFHLHKSVMIQIKLYTLYLYAGGAALTGTRGLPGEH